MNSSASNDTAPVPSLWVSAVRMPLLFLFVGLAMYGFVRWLAPDIDPTEFVNVIGLGALIGAAVIELAMRRRKKRGNGNGA